MHISTSLLHRHWRALADFKIVHGPVASRFLIVDDTFLMFHSPTLIWSGHTQSVKMSLCGENGGEWHNIQRQQQRPCLSPHFKKWTFNKFSFSFKGVVCKKCIYNNDKWLCVTRYEGTVLISNTLIIDNSCPARMFSLQKWSADNGF